MIRAIVLAAGKGTRMKSARSKVLHEICGRPMLWYVTDERCATPASRRSSSWSTRSSKSRSIASTSAACCKREQLGTGHAVRVALERLEPRAGGRIVVACGDMPLVTEAIFRDIIGSLDAPEADGAVMSLVTVKMPLPSNFGRIVRRGARPSSASSKCATQRPTSWRSTR